VHGAIKTETIHCQQKLKPSAVTKLYAHAIGGGPLVEKIKTDMAAATAWGLSFLFLFRFRGRIREFISSLGRQY
jgi:hypothetical protein